jgi:hypothetical protein
VFTGLDERERAIACLLRARGVNAEHRGAHLAMAQNLLAQGDMASGWIEYEWRNLTEAGRGQLPKITSAPWNSMHIPSGRILLVGDQGYGDTIQFARYIPMSPNGARRSSWAAASKCCRCCARSRALRTRIISGMKFPAMPPIAGCPACLTCSKRR